MYLLNRMLSERKTEFELNSFMVIRVYSQSLIIYPRAFDLCDVNMLKSIVFLPLLQELTIKVSKRKFEHRSVEYFDVIPEHSFKNNTERINIFVNCCDIYRIINFQFR